MTNFVFTSALVVIVAGVFVSGQDASWGSCPDVKTVKELDINKYLGTWYEIKAVDNWFQSGKCGSAQYSLKDNGHIKVVNTEYLKNGTKQNQAIGDAYRPDDSDAGKLKVRFFSLAPYGKYWVLDTDYNYSVVYSCTNLVVGKLTYIWILARERTLDATTLARLEGELTAQGVDISPLKLSDQTDC